MSGNVSDVYLLLNITMDNGSYMGVLLNTFDTYDKALAELRHFCELCDYTDFGVWRALPWVDVADGKFYLLRCTKTRAPNDYYGYEIQSWPVN